MYFLKKLSFLFFKFFKHRRFIFSTNRRTFYLNFNPYIQFFTLIIFSLTSLYLYNEYIKYLQAKNVNELKIENTKLKKVNKKLNHRVEKIEKDLHTINKYIDFDKRNSLDEKISNKISDRKSLDNFENLVKPIFADLYSKIEKINFEAESAFNLLEIENRRPTRLIKNKDLIQEILNENAIGGPFEKYTEEDRLEEEKFVEKVSKVKKIKKKDYSDFLNNKINNTIKIKTIINAAPLSSPSENNEYLIAGHFGKRLDPFTNEVAMHKGIDLYILDDKVFSTIKGVVTKSGNFGSYGNLIEIEGLDSKYKFFVRFAHLDKILVKKGDEVNVGSLIGIQGNTGRSKGKHLHYEIINDKGHLNPIKFLTFKNKVSKT